LGYERRHISSFVDVRRYCCEDLAERCYRKVALLQLHLFVLDEQLRDRAVVFDLGLVEVLYRFY
jgi:hypothetical protein